MGKSLADRVIPYPRTSEQIRARKMAIDLLDELRITFEEKSISAAMDHSQDITKAQALWAVGHEFSVALNWLIFET
jgi:hypothetical protein